MKRMIVCVKPVPDPKHWDKLTMDPVTRTLKREGIPTVINPLDKNALEAALQLREVLGGEVVLLAMAPPFASAALREGLAMGADRAVLLSDRAFAGSDTVATAAILASGCRRIGEFHVVLCGNMSADGSTAQVSSQLAEFLDVPNVMHVIGVQSEEDGDFIITQKIEQGTVRIRGRPPLLLAVRKELNKPRYIGFSGILAAEAKEIQVLSNRELGMDPAIIGIDGSPTKMAGLELRKFERAGERLSGTPEEIVDRLVERIYQYGVI